MAREDCESVGEMVYDVINPVLARLYAITQDHQWILPAKREAVERLRAGINRAWNAYYDEVYGTKRSPQFTDSGQIQDDDGGSTPADIAGEVRDDIG
jgi:hypothetical protein